MENEFLILNPHLKNILNKKMFSTLSRKFPSRFKKNLFMSDTSGQIIHSNSSINLSDNLIKTSMTEALRWGESNVVECQGDSGAIIAPVILNAQLIGSFGWFGENLFSVAKEFSSEFILDTSQKLIDALVSENLTNKQLLDTNKNAMIQNRISAEFLHETKSIKLKVLREAYMLREDSMLSAIKLGNRQLARQYLNEILIYIYGQCVNRPELIKAHLIEMSVMMIRGAIELGVSKIESFENSYKMLSELSTITDEESMCLVITKLLENVMDNIENANTSNSERKFKLALKYLKQNFTNPQLTRRNLADYSRLSERQLTELFKKFTSKGFSENLSELRISRACQLMLLKSNSATEIAYDVGFSDQSYFSKIFKKYTNLTPTAFRKKMLKS